MTQDELWLSKYNEVMDFMGEWGNGGQAPVPIFIFSELRKNTPISTEIGDK